MAKRAYEQRLRAEAAEANRRRILDTLYERLREAPAEPITVDEIARRARVARSTIYLVFGSRSGLFDALTDQLLRGAGLDRIIDALRHPDARESLRGAIAGSVEQYAAHHDVLRILASMAKLDPEGVGRAIERVEQQRSRGIARLARRLHRQGHVRPGLTLPRTTAMIWLLASFETYDTLASGQSLPPHKVAEILVDTAENALLAGA